MKDRVKIGNGKSSKLKCPQGYTPSGGGGFEGFLADLKLGNVYVDITPNNSTDDATKGVSEVGTPINVANMLSDATATKMGFTTSTTPSKADATVDSAFDRMNTFYDGTLVAGSTTLTISGANITTDGRIDIYTSVFGVSPKTVSVANGSITMTFYSAQAENIGVKVRCY